VSSVTELHKTSQNGKILTSFEISYKDRNKVSTGDFKMFCCIVECTGTTPYRKCWLFMNKPLKHKQHDPWDKENYYFIVTLLNNTHGNSA
jgi:hypothetical protein